MARPTVSAEEPENQQGAGNRTHDPSTQRTGPDPGFARRLTALLNQTENGGLDEDTYNDGKDPYFKDWLLAIKQKLITNADHFPNPMMRITYVTSRTEGNARKHITPCLQEDAVNPYQDSTDLLKHLENIFADPNRERVTKQKYSTLYMKPSAKWNDFISEFLYLTAEASVPKESWKDNLYNKLSLRMQELTMPAYNNDDKTFREFTDYCSRTATNIKNMERIKARLNSSANACTRGTGVMSRATTLAAAAPSMDNTTACGYTATASPAPSNLDDETRKRLMNEGKCFTCFQVGHTSRSCPTKQAAQLKVLEQPVKPTPKLENRDA
ncbi:hypothetical protein CNMCM7691_004440 [Aspergillus felis]|uniref:CCHC-type domain-containing protein n=1 Tax=Aspergillus felis TaxID=1287682 RepID=A0A8H6VEG0_9EURO|nr:hypothetical protein CNMCM7691_004440 [Aspergillus felis]